MAKKIQNAETSRAQLRPEVAEMYAVRKGLQRIFACSEFGMVDLSQVDLMFAAQLAEHGYLIEKKLHQADA